MSGSTKRFPFLGYIYLFRSYIRVFFQLVVFVKEHIWHKVLLMGCLVRLEFYMEVISLFFLECVYLSLLIGL